MPLIRPIIDESGGSEPPEVELLLEEYFDESPLDSIKWDLDNGSANIAEGECQVVSSSWKGLLSKQAFTGDLLLELYFKHPENNGHIGLTNADYSKQIFLFTNYGAEAMWLNTVGGESGTVNITGAAGITAENYHKMEIIKRPEYVLIRADGVNKVINVNDLGEETEFKIFVGSWSGQTYYLDYIKLYSIPAETYPEPPQA